MEHDSSIRLRTVWRPKGTLQPEGLKKLRQAMAAIGVHEESVAYFMHHPGFAKEREKVLRHLNV